MIYPIAFCRLTDAACTAAIRAAQLIAITNVAGHPTLEGEPTPAAAGTEWMDRAPYHLYQVRRDAVLEAIQEVCAHRGWTLLAAHVRSNHVHTVVAAAAGGGS